MTNKLKELNESVSYVNGGTILSDLDDGELYSINKRNNNEKIRELKKFIDENAKPR